MAANGTTSDVGYARRAADPYFNGYIDEIGVWTSMLSNASDTPIQVLDFSLVGMLLHSPFH